MFPLFYGCHVGGAEHGDSILGSVLMPQSTVGFLSSFLIELNDSTQTCVSPFHFLWLMFVFSRFR